MKYQQKKNPESIDSEDPNLAVATPWSIELDEVVSSGHHGLESCICELYKPSMSIWNCSLPIILVKSEENCNSWKGIVV